MLMSTTNALPATKPSNGHVPILQQSIAG